MKAAKKISCYILLATLLTTCGKFPEEHPTVKVTLSTSRLKAAPIGFTYEAWVRLNGQAISLGRFSVDASRAMPQDTFEIDQHDLMASSNVFVTLEPSSDDLDTPSKYVIMDGVFTDDVARLSVGGPLAFKADFSQAKADFVIQTPTHGISDSDRSGLWFYNGKAADPKASLSLPKLPPAWVYEAVFKDAQGVTFSLGSFPVSKAKTDTESEGKKQSEGQTAKAEYGAYVPIRGADSGNPYSLNPKPAPAFPGEDFFVNPPPGSQFPLDVQGGRLSIIVRGADRENARAFSIYRADIPQSARANTLYPMSRNTQLPTGRLNRAAATQLF